MDKINYLIQGIKAGNIWVNCYSKVNPQAPFGGFKDSGIEREMGEHGLKHYTEIKNVVIKIAEKNS